MTQEFLTSSSGGVGTCRSAPPLTNLDLAAADAGVGRTARSTQRRQHEGGLFAADLELSLEQLPIRKRYLKSHSDELSGDGSPARGVEEKRAASGGDLDARLRAGVIRHSSDPTRCLAYYYANKNPS
jgi:hypothetical protein